MTASGQTATSRPEVRIAERAGFCYGVRLAIDKARQASEAGEEVTTLGQLVHNPGIKADLEARGIQTADLPTRWRAAPSSSGPRRPSRGARNPPGQGGHPARRRHLHLGHPEPEGRPGAERGGLHGVHHWSREPSRGARSPLLRRREARRGRRHGPIHLGARAPDQEARGPQPVHHPALQARGVRRVLPAPMSRHAGRQLRCAR